MLSQKTENPQFTQNLGKYIKIWAVISQLNKSFQMWIVSIVTAAKIVFGNEGSIRAYDTEQDFISTF